MKTADIIRRAGRNLRQAKVRTLLTALAISVGAFTITLAMAAGNGANLYTNKLISNNGDSRSLSVFAKTSSRDSAAPQKYGETSSNGQQLLNDNDVAKIQKVTGVESVAPMYNVSAAYMTGSNNEKYQTTVTIKQDQTNVSLAAGSLENNQPSDGKVILSESYVSVLGFASDQDAIGKTITLHVVPQTLEGLLGQGGKDMSLTVQAVDKKTDTVLQYSAGVRISAADGKAIYAYENPTGAAQYYGVTVQVAKGADLAVVEKAIKAEGYQAFSLQDLQQVLFTIVNVVMAGVAGFGALAILASIFGIINTQYISVLERTQQIGLMRALGARRVNIMWLFLFEAAWVGFLGGLIGTIGAMLIGLFNPAIASALKLDKGTDLLVYSPVMSIMLILALMLVAVLAGLFPSFKAARLDPIEALRTE